MNWQRVFVPVAGVALVAAAWRAYGWAGVAVAAGGIVMWVLLHFTRLMHVLKQAADRPVGYVASAVMLNAKLQAGMPLLKVIALTRALGELRSEPDAQPEVFRWSDTGGSQVTCTFANGRLLAWGLERPADPPVQGPAAGQSPSAD
ncbi:MAG: glycerate kinase [Ramlibacter sp.]|jgi:hypothetical protein